MRNIIFLILICLLSFPKVSFAVLDMDNGIVTEGTGGQCNWEPFLENLGRQETGYLCGGGSCDKQYTVVRDTSNPFNGSREASWGKYQFIPGTWTNLVLAEYPQCVRYRSTESLPGAIGSTKNSPYLPYAISKTCWDVQDYAAKKFLQQGVEYLKKNNWCGALGQQIQGTHVGGKQTNSCTVTKSGLLSAWHNRNSLCPKLMDAGTIGQHLRYRVCDAEGIPFPEDCNPSTEKPTVPEEIEQPTYSTPPIIENLPKGHFSTLQETIKYIWVAAFQQMTSQLTTTMMQQMQVIGSFFDAKHQLETQRLMQQKVAQAHKDYHPSLQMCEIGTFARDLANTEIRAELSKTALNRAMLDRALGSGDVKTIEGALSDGRTRRKAYIDKFCSTEDNAKQNDLLCEESGDPAQQNADINFTQTIDAPLTLDINLLEGTEDSMEKENIFAFLDYIFMHNSFPFVSESKTEYHPFIGPYQDMRSLIAIRSVAQNSFANIIAQKTAGPEGDGDSAAPFLKSLMREIGLQDTEIENTIGKNPSYYAQMEILTKKIYQHPEFITNLYDKPANVKRIRAALSAIKLMQDRDIHDSMLRREMLVSMILELKLRQKQTKLNNQLEFIISHPPGTPLPKNPIYGSGDNNDYGVGTYDEENGTGGF